LIAVKSSAHCPRAPARRLRFSMSDCSQKLSPLPAGACPPDCAFRRLIAVKNSAHCPRALSRPIALFDVRLQSKAQPTARGRMPARLRFSEIDSSQKFSPLHAGVACRAHARSRRRKKRLTRPPV